MKVFVLGVTGFVGEPVAQAFVRSGHIVYGQTRSADKAKQLRKDEVIAVVADPMKAEQWEQVLHEVDVVVDCLGGTDPELARIVFRTAAAHAKAHRPMTMGPASPKLVFIHTGGTWVHAEGPGKWVDERREPAFKVKLTAFRRETETAILTNTEVNGIVIRPAVVYGRSGSLLTMYFAAAAEAAAKGAQFTVPGSEDGRMSMVHVDDLADLYLRAAERSHLVKGLALVAVNDSTESTTDVMNRLNKLAGAKGWSYRSPANLFEAAMSSTMMLKPSVARALVGWQPRKMSLSDGLDIYWTSWTAAQP